MKSTFKALLGLAFCIGLMPAAEARYFETRVDRLARMAEEFFADSYRGFNNRGRGNRQDVEVLFLAQQINAGAGLLRRMAYDRRPESELRDAVAIVSGQLRAAERYSHGRRQLQDMQRVLEDISRELSPSQWRPVEPVPEKKITGRLRWKGTVDGEVHVFVQGAEADVRTVSGFHATNVTFQFTSALPQRRVELGLRKLDGRGSLEVVQHPSPDNGFTAVIRISDTKHGQDKYEFELVW